MAARSIVSNSLAGGLRVVALLSLRLSVPPSELECPLMEQARSNHCSNWSLLWSFQSRRIFKDKATMKHYLLSQAWCDLDLVASSIIDESLKHTFIPFLSSHVLRIRFLFFFFYLIQQSRIRPLRDVWRPTLVQILRRFWCFYASMKCVCAKWEDQNLVRRMVESGTMRWTYSILHVRVGESVAVDRNRKIPLFNF